MSSIQIRSANVDDAERIAVLLGELGYPTPPDEVVRRLDMLRGPDNAVRVAVLGERVVGSIGLHRQSGLHSSLSICYIMSLVVDSAVRGQGIGTLLLGEAERWARERGCDRILVTSANHRIEAHAFYEGHGFPQTGRRFAKQLDPSPEFTREG
jgi:GNAT superfamily N-acetyltransferase